MFDDSFGYNGGTCDFPGRQPVASIRVYGPARYTWQAVNQRRLVILDEFHPAETSASYALVAAAAIKSGAGLVLTATAERCRILALKSSEGGDAGAQLTYEMAVCLHFRFCCA